jgi:predicted lipoprotein with Yx(FWY)xxD motif
MVTAAGALALVLAVPVGSASATSSQPKTVKVSTAKVAGIGTVLTTGSGLTLYRFTEDKPGGPSSCSGACAKIWPPLLASKGAHVSAPKGVKGLTVMNVGNGHWQVAFHKIPLYRFESDKKKGQALGQKVGNVWFAAMKSGVPASNAAPASATTPTTAAPSAPTTQAPTPTTQSSGQSTPAPAITPTTRAPAPPPTTTPPTSPPATTPPTSPPATTPTMPAGGGGYGY